MLKHASYYGWLIVVDNKIIVVDICKWWCLINDYWWETMGIQARSSPQRYLQIAGLFPGRSCPKRWHLGYLGGWGYHHGCITLSDRSSPILFAEPSWGFVHFQDRGCICASTSFVICANKSFTSYTYMFCSYECTCGSCAYHRHDWHDLHLQGWQIPMLVGSRSRPRTQASPKSLESGPLVALRKRWAWARHPGTINGKSVGYR